MKVEPNKAGRSGAREADKSSVPRSEKEGGVPVRFVEQLAGARERASRDALEQYLAELDEAGAALVRNPTRENLDRYKLVLQQFMHGAVVLTYTAEKKSVYNRRVGFETRVVHKIDEALQDLTEQVLQQNRRPMRILQKIGEIRGLLVDALL